MEFKRTEYLKKLVAREHDGLVKIITGTRRAGKSYLLNEIFYRHLISHGISKKNIIRFAFDIDEDTDKLDVFLPGEPTKLFIQKDQYKVNAKKFRLFIASLTTDDEEYYLLLDEVQLLDGFVGTLNGFLRHRNFDVYVTGSNSRLLSTDIATEFKGRGSVVHVLPLSFSEYLSGFSLSKEDCWKNYIETGGIPLVAAMASQEERITYLTGLCEETYLKDIIIHNNVRNPSEISDLFDVLASTIGCPMNPTNIVRTFKSVKHKDVCDDTMEKYLGFFIDSFVVAKARKYDVKGRQYIGSPYKLYFEDIGVRNARLGFRQIEEPHIMENIIFNELRYRGFLVDVGEVKMYEKTDRLDKNGKSIYEGKSLEVDFIATQGSKKYYIQSSLEVPSEQKEQQEKKPLWYIDDSFKKIIVTKDILNVRRDEYGIMTINLFDFLLNPNSLDL